MSIGQRIIELRKEKNISQNQLASALSVTRQAVSKWENDLSCPDSLKLIALADILGTDVEYLATGRTPLPPPAPVVMTKVETVEKVVQIPVIQRIVRKKHVRNPIEYALIGIVCFAAGLLIGLFI